MCVSKHQIEGGKPIQLWTDKNTVEPEALKQLENISKLGWVFKHVAVMPDTHFGKGATVGSVIAMKDALSPAAVGVDIGCGMAAIKTNLTASMLPDSLKDIRHQVERDIPVGFNWHKEEVISKLTPDNVLFDAFDTLNPKVHKLKEKALQQAGTLGGGNHFIELCLDTKDNVWMMLHSGSRNIGKELAEYHIGVAKTLAHNQDLPDKDLAVFLANTPEMKAYRHDLEWSQAYAFLNRKLMIELYVRALKRFYPKLETSDFITCHHNYVSEEIHFGEEVLVTRKGAISAELGKMGIIPGSMGSKSFIVRGLGNPESFNSASHGAGRRMSRGAAKRRFTIDDMKEQTAGVECRKDAGVLDEIPGAYKNINDVMNYQKDLVEIVVELKQVMCIKG